MRTVVGSRGCSAVDLLFRVAGLGKAASDTGKGEPNMTSDADVSAAAGCACRRWLVAGARNHLQANRSVEFRFEILI